ncbi:MAG: hypothetical protein M1365_09940 [Actinobacteria bacterium]|nr:hypothetical protein [Actinomycetota bacterium]
MIIKKKVQKRTRLQPKTVLTKYADNPIISPIAENGWEAWQTFNPGVILLDNKVHFLYRAIGQDGIVRYVFDDQSMSIQNDMIVSELSKIN